MPNRFKVGDRVIATSEHDGNRRIINVSGEIIGLCYGVYEVVFDEDIGGHTHHDRCRSGTGWRIPGNKLKLEARELSIPYDQAVLYK